MSHFIELYTSDDQMYSPSQVAGMQICQKSMRHAKRIPPVADQKIG